MASSHGEDPTRFGHRRPWLPLLLVPLVAVFATFAILGVRADATRDADAQLRYAKVQAAVAMLSSLEWRAISEGRVTAETREGLGRMDRELASSFTFLAKADSDDDRGRSLADGVARYRELVDTEFALISAGRLDDADALDQAVDLAFEEVSAELARTERREGEQAVVARRRADQMTALALGIAAVCVFLLLWRYDASRRRTSAARERELGLLAAEREQEAAQDALTGLPNRREFLRRATQALDEDPACAVLLLDLDGFKEVNDTLGHRAGDDLLRQVAARLEASLARPGTVARLGGDEFAVLLPGVSAQTADAEAESLGAATQLPYSVEDVPLHLEASFGIAVAPADGEDVDTLLQRADVAMYEAKRGRTGRERYDASRDQHSKARLALLGDLRAALDADELVLHFQPKVELASGRVPGVEALVRWQHPERGLLGPQAFLPFVEQTSLMRPLSLWVLDRALAQCAAWRRAGVEVAVAVNLAAPNLLDRRLAADVRALLERHGLEPRWLAVEVTEGLIMADSARAAEVLAEVADLGVTVALDDFGTGHSSLTRLKRLRVDELKIDKSFVLGMEDDHEDAAIVRSTIELAHSLGLRVVAKGVETLATARRLTELRCDLAQGFGLCRPIPAEDFTAWLAEREQAVAASFRVELGTAERVQRA